MMITGELEKNKIIVTKSKDIGRLYNKSHIGEILSANILELNLIESVFLLDERKIKIFHKKKEVDFEGLVKIASKDFKDFEIKYLVFKDLRKRGQIVKLCKKEESFDFYKFQTEEGNEGKFFVCVFSERDLFDIEKTRSLLENISENCQLWFAIVDDEGDITYYSVSFADLKGKNKSKNFKEIKGVFLEERVLVFDEKKSEDLFKKEFFGKPFGPALQLSFVEVLYLLEKNYISLKDINGKKLSKDKFLKIAKKAQPDIISKLKVFKDLKEKGLIVKTGFKFGTHFRVYTSHPDKIHAEYLVHILKKDSATVWAEFSRAVRLAHSVNKEIVFARVFNNNIEYINFGRLRP